jgi:hypothetical protein
MTHIRFGRSDLPVVVQFGGIGPDANETDSVATHVTLTHDDTIGQHTHTRSSDGTTVKDLLWLINYRRNQINFGSFTLLV